MDIKYVLFYTMCVFGKELKNRIKILVDQAVLNGSQLAKMKKSIPEVSLP